jgi:hypothetical protein
LGQACGQCRGACCAQGGTRAFIAQDTIETYLDSHDGASAEDVIAAYMSYVPARTFQNACVYQAVHGCALPRDMRASICNTFYCGGLREYMDTLVKDAPPRAFFEAEDGGPMRYAFVDAREVRVVRRAAAVERVE